MKYDVKLSTIFVKVCYLNVFPVTKVSWIYSLIQNAKKILILDWNVHFGDGTSEIFLADMHCYPFWSFSNSAKIKQIGIGDGKCFNCNICWEGITDDDLFVAFDYIVMPLANEFDPDIILISGGFDVGWYPIGIVLSILI
jgi:acetoin utilization deacetylase AcuC-like enzyme